MTVNGEYYDVYDVLYICKMESILSTNGNTNTYIFLSSKKKFHAIMVFIEKNKFYFLVVALSGHALCGQLAP